MDKQEIAEMLLYNKLVDDILFLGNNAILQMNVMLYKTNFKSQKKEFFYKEVQYLNASGEIARKCTRFIDSYLTITSLAAVDGMKESIILRGRDLEILRVFLVPKLETILQNFQDIFQMRDNKLYVNEEMKPIQVDITSMNKYLVFKPGVHKLYNDEVQPCMEMYMNSPNIMSIMTFYSIYDLLYIIRTFQLQTYASNMLAYYGRIPYGFNMYDLSNDYIVNAPKEYIYEAPEPLRVNDRKKGFFDNNNGIE